MTFCRHWLCLYVSLWGLCLASSLHADDRSNALCRDFQPDPVAVQRFEKAWKYPQAGWLVLHIEGSPYQRGVQHGRLLAREIVDYIKTIARVRSHKDPEAAWKSLRLLTDTAFLRRYNVECLEEMKGIADGAAAAGAKFDGRRLDLLDIVALNSDVEAGFLESALQATPTGIDELKFDRHQASPPAVKKREMCSAFVATTPATDKSTGGVMLGHITMSDLSWVQHFNVWLDITPSKGHRFVCQTFPGGIQSGLDYYISASGLIIAETTIDQTFLDVTGETESSRIRRAVQYSNTIDEVVAILSTKNNGLYTNEWLIADTKTNEIAMFELGTKHTKLWRSSRDEWLSGTKGFYWSCNNPKDRDVLSNTVAAARGKPGNLTLHPARRDVAWLKIFDKHHQQGGLTEAFGFEAFQTPPIAAYPSCDAKFTTSVMAKDLSSWALFGPPLGRAWTPSAEELAADPDVKPLIANDWTLIRMLDLSSKDAAKKVAGHDSILAGASGLSDREPFPSDDESKEPTLKFEQRHPFAWRGTLRAKSDADLGLAAAFAEYEKVVAFEHALQADSKENKLDLAAQEAVAVALFTHQSNWWSARQRLGHDIAWKKAKPDDRNLNWYPIALGQSIAMLCDLRQKLNAEAFDRLMDEFGMKHADGEFEVAEFRSHFESEGEPAVKAVFAKWLDRDVAAKDHVSGRWSIHSFEMELDKTLIVFGGSTNPVANLEIAERLQRAVARRFGNTYVTLRSGRDVSEADLKSHHLLVIGEPTNNSMLLKAAAKSAVKFGTQSFNMHEETFADHDSGVIVASENPWNDRFSVVTFAGLSPRATYRLADALSPDEETSPQIVIMPANRAARRVVVR
ncbi:MAG: C45 family autoproteolytic acyltransferase/hydrolase [Planctomycetia bacterium]|nr:C45 family autoproteolytic acyltransferase/hydrolase [Planctomycetia bacterium]